MKVLRRGNLQFHTGEYVDVSIVDHDVTISGDFTLTGSIIVNAGATLTFSDEFDPSGSSTTTISGTLDARDSMTLSSNALVTITSTGNLEAREDLNVDSGTLNVDAGGA